MRTNDIVNYADDTTPYSCANDIPTAISELQAQQKKGFCKLFANTLKNICIGIHFNGSFWHTVCSLNRIMNCLAGIFREYFPKFSEKRFYETVSNRLHVFHNQSIFSVQAKDTLCPHVTIWFV